MALNALLYYNAITGEAATGGMDELGRHQFLQRFTDTPGWTHIVATKESLLYYNSNTAEIATAQIDARGNHRFLQRYPANDLTNDNAAWIQIAATEDHILFYNATTGRAEIGEIDPLGNYRSLQRYTDFALGWTNIAAIQNRVLYYNRNTTELATALIDSAGNHQWINRYPAGSAAVWTQLVSTQNYFLFYNVDEGGGNVSRIDELGNYLSVQDFPGLSKTWNQIACTQKHVLFYSASPGVAATADIDQEGVLRDLNFYDNFPKDLTHIVAPKIATLPEVPPPDEIVRDPIVELLRPDDLLNLRIECRNLQLDRSDRANPVLVPTDTSQIAYLIVQFPPQSIAEEAVYEPRKDPGNNLEADPNRQSTETNAEKIRREEEEKARTGALTQSIQTLLQGSARARIAKPSRLVFQLAANSSPRIPYSTAGLLNWAGLELNVAPVAAMPQLPTSEQLANAPAIAPPSDTETAMEMPFRLILSPNRNVAWTHALTPRTHSGRTELWHTQLVNRIVNQEGEQTIALSKANPALLRAIWSPDYVAPGFGVIRPSWPPLGEADEWNGLPVLTAMNKRDRHELVILTAAFGGFVEDDSPRYPDYLPTPIQAEQVMLSPLGGWLKSRGNWKPPVEWINERIRLIPINPGVENPIEPPLEDWIRVLDPALRDRLPVDFLRRRGSAGRALNISEWVHVATQGRDHYVRIVYEGYLYPFGHRAALIKVTERKFKTVGGTPFAYLAQRMFIVVRQPLKDYTQESLENQGLGMPLKQVRLTTLVTPDIDLPQKTPPDEPKISPIIKGTDYCFWVRVNQQDFRFHVVGQDSAGHPIDFTTALIFVPNSERDKLDKVKIDYGLNTDRRKCEVPGQPVTYAARNGSTSDNTTLTTRSLYFDTEANNFLPKLYKAEVNLAAVEQITGKAAPTTIAYYDKYLNPQGFANNNGMFATIVKETEIGTLVADAIKSTFAADKAGGIATPDLSIRGITREQGAVAAPLAGALEDAANNIFKPADFFKDVENSAKLFGKLPIAELIEAGTFANAPKIQALPQASPPEVQLNWTPKIKAVDVGFFKFQPIASSVLEIKSRIQKPTGSGVASSRIEGKLTDFHLEFLEVVQLNFVSFAFTSVNNQKMDVEVKLKPGKNEALKFIGDLTFINELRDSIPSGLFGKGASLEITPEPAIRAGFNIGLPPIAVGVFALKDISLGATLTLPFLDGSPLFDFNISERQRPFNLTIAFFGGGGFFRLQLDTKEVRIVEAAFEFGACASVNLGVASGGVHIMAGIYFKLESKTVKRKLAGGGVKDESLKATTLEGFFRMGGELSILGLISVSLEFLLSFTYKSVPAGTGKAFGMAKLTVKVEILFFSKSFEIKLEKQFSGDSNDPVFAQAWDELAIWDEYTTAFA